MNNGILLCLGCAALFVLAAYACTRGNITLEIIAATASIINFIGAATLLLIEEIKNHKP